MYRFEREPSGTTAALRSVLMSPETSRKTILAVGDRGTALRRDPVKGWVREATGTAEDLHAIVYAPLHEGSGGLDESSALHIAVGAHGTAAVRTAKGAWTVEKTGTDKDLLGVLHLGMSTLAVGAGGVMVQRFFNGKWRRVPTRTTSDLHAFNTCYPHLCVLGAGGAILDCGTSRGELVCIPRPPFVGGELPADVHNIFYKGNSVAIGGMLQHHYINPPPQVWKLWLRDGSSASPDDAMESAWTNHWYRETIRDLRSAHLRATPDQGANYLPSASARFTIRGVRKITSSLRVSLERLR